jgi:hypothetical protein
MKDDNARDPFETTDFDLRPEPESGPLTVQCAWCSRVREADGRWVAAPRRHDHPVSHTICPDCASRMLR